MTTQIASLPAFLHFLLFLLIIITLCAVSSHGCHEDERMALLNFKSSLDDPSNRLSSWQESIQHRNCCAWHGIKCSGESLHVVMIDLRNTKLEEYVSEFYSNHYNGYDSFDPPNTVLRGKFSPSLLNIKYLEYLDFAFNDFQESETPLPFPELTKLTHLDLSNTNLSASISTSFTNISSLQYLDLSCDTTRIFLTTTSCLELPSLKWMRGLVNLQVLRLSGVDLYQATSSEQNFTQHLSHLWNLRDLDISDCGISGPVFPIHEFHNLSHLSTLQMNNNYNINSTIPLQLANLTSLSTLELSGCDLQGSIPYLPQLKELDVSDNDNLNSNLTRMFEHHWPRLQKLDITSTSATRSIPSSISNKAPLLVSLSATYCEIQESLPDSVSNLKYLTFLDLSYNKIQGPIPKSICKTLPLQELYLWDNNITGSIPSCITNLPNLSVFNVGRNFIGGKVSLISLINKLNLTELVLCLNKLTLVIDQYLYPSKFNLRYLRLDSLNMKGLIPGFICNFTHLKYLDLSDNNLTGTIPSCISELKNLHHLDLSKNRFGGPLPLLPQRVGVVDLSSNNLNGEISIENGERISTITDIFLNDNELSGSIPSSLCSHKVGMSHITRINFSKNKLSRIIPASIGHCNSLSYLNLGSNDLTGNFPTELRHTSLYELDLSNNNFDGTFPMVIQNQLNLGLLNLGNNKFEGYIPAGLGSLSYLVILSLRSNRFNGSIPEEIIHLQQLQVLDFSSNNLSGPIPTKLGNLTSLTNRFSVNIGRIIVPGSIGGNIMYSVQYQLAIKGTMVHFEQDDICNSGIDLSSNVLTGNIPEEIGLLQGLRMLNLSHNLFSSNIPASVGNMSSLESLDLSFNRLSGHVPQSLTSIDSLEILSLSNNNLSGRIPRGEHFDTLSVDGSAFDGNDLLCGFPSAKDCDDGQNIDAGGPSSKVDEDDGEDVKEKFLLYAIVAMGIAVGFWGLFFVLLLRRQKWWFPYWRTVDSVAARMVECIHKKQQ